MSVVFDTLFGVTDTKVFALAQVISPNDDYDCGVITAFHPKYAKDENAKRHKSLHAKLLMAGCSLASVTGKYVTGNGITLKKKALLAVDGRKQECLLEALQQLGDEFEQDSVLFIPKGTRTGKTQAFLLGTNREHCVTGPQYGEKQSINAGACSEPCPASYAFGIDGRPFVLSKKCAVIPYPHGMIWMVINSIAKQNWREITF